MLSANILKGACFGAFAGVIGNMIMSNLYIKDVGLFYWMGDPNLDIHIFIGKFMIVVMMGLGAFLNLISNGRFME